MISSHRLFFSLLILLFVAVACTPEVEEGVDLPAPPTASFSVAELEGVPNTYVVSSESSGFLHFYDFGNGLTSNEPNDTVVYPFEGVYEIEYSVSNAGGMGRASDMVTVENSIAVACEGTLALLTGCDEQKAWRLTSEVGAVVVGPTPYSSAWFTSSEGGLQNEQYDDRYEFTVEGELYSLNQGLSVNPFQDFTPVPLDIPVFNFQLTEGTGTSGEDQIILPSCRWLGIWNTMPVYDILELTEDRLVVHAPIRLEDCTQDEEGYFTLTFEADE